MSRSGAVISVSMVPARFSSAKSRIVITGGTTRRMIQVNIPLKNHMSGVKSLGLSDRIVTIMLKLMPVRPSTHTPTM